MKNIKIVAATTTRKGLAQMRTSFQKHALWFLLLIPIGLGIFIAQSENWHIALFLVALGVFGYNDASKGRLDFDLDDF